MKIANNKTRKINILNAIPKKTMLAHDLALGDTARVETEMEMLEIITDSR